MVDLNRLDWPAHGGDPTALLRQFGLSPATRVEDVSANLNPLGPPDWVAAWLGERLSGLSHYPAPDYAAARTALAARHGLAPAQVLLTNGGAEAIFLAAALHHGGRALLPSPSFGEYARACRAHAMTTREQPLTPPDFSLTAAPLVEAARQADVVFVCRPNNPTGTLMAADEVETLLARTCDSDTLLVVDEAFIDLSPGAVSLTPLLARYPRLVLLRSMTKFYTLPGLRLGYVLAHPDVIERLAARQPPWSVNHLAAELIPALLADQSFSQRTAAWLATEQPRMAAALAGLALDVVPSQTCFYLLRPNEALRRAGLDSARLLERLLRHGFLARHTFSFSGLDGQWLRLALRDKADNDRLVAVLHDCLC